MWDVVLSTGSNHKLGFCMFASPVLKHTHFSINSIYTHAIISPGPKARNDYATTFLWSLLQRGEKKEGTRTERVNVITPKHKKVLKIAECTIMCSG